MKYKIFKEDGIYTVYSGYIEYNNWIKENVEFYSSNLADCYIWIKAVQENLIEF